MVLRALAMIKRNESVEEEWKEKSVLPFGGENKKGEKQGSRPDRHPYSHQDKTNRKGDTLKLLGIFGGKMHDSLVVGSQLLSHTSITNIIYLEV